MKEIVYQIIIAYLLGSIPFGLLLSLIFQKVDIRTIGSGNIGATNVLRTGNKKLAALTLFLDLLKGFIACWIFKDSHLGYIIIAALIGHIFPIWLRFKGGKGVATYAGILLGLNLYLGLICCSVWISILKLFKVSSVAGLILAFSSIIVLFLIDKAEFYKMWPYLLICIGIITFRHLSNIKRLIKKQEAKVI